MSSLKIYTFYQLRQPTSWLALRASPHLRDIVAQSRARSHTRRLLQARLHKLPLCSLCQLEKNKLRPLAFAMGRSIIRVATHVAGIPTSRVRYTGRTPGFHPNSEGGRNSPPIRSHQPRTL